MRYRVKHTEIDNFRSFPALLPPPKNPKIKFKKNENICWIYLPKCVPVSTKNDNHIDVRFMRQGVSQTKFFVISGHFLLIYHPLMISKIKIWKINEKNDSRYYSFIQTCVP